MKSKKNKRKTKKDKAQKISDEMEDITEESQDKPVGIPDEFSIDSLLQARKNQINDFHLGEFGKDIISSDFSSEDPEFTPTLDISPYVPRDGSTFDLSQGNFPFRIFQLLDCPSNAPAHCLPLLKQWQWLAISYNYSSFPLNATFLFTLIQELIVKKSNELGMVLIQYASLFPPNSLNDFDMWFDFVREAMHSSVQSVVFLLAIGDINLFKFKDDQSKQHAIDFIILLHISAMLCPAISKNQLYGFALKQLRKLLKENKVSESQIAFYVETTNQISLDIPVQSISLLVSMFPLVGNGVDFINKITIKMGLCLIYDVEEIEDEKCNLRKFVEELPQLKYLCESVDDDDVLKASTIIALAERAVVTSIQLGIITSEIIEFMIKQLKFSISSSDPGILTSIKEQIHVTRTQLENFLLTDQIAKTLKHE